MMDVGDDVGTRQDQDVEIALEIVAVTGEPRAAEIRFAELTALNHRPHRTIEDENAFGQEAAKNLRRVVVSWLCHVFSFPPRSTP